MQAKLCGINRISPLKQRYRLSGFFVLTSACGLAVLLPASGHTKSQPETIVIRGARVIDGTGSPAKDETVLLRGNRIAAVGVDIAVPADARVMDAKGETLLPGLFDLHTHLQSSSVPHVAGDWAKNIKSYLACGVTSINDYGEYGEQLEPLRKLQSSGVAIGPTIHYAVRLGTTGGHGTEFGWGDFMTLQTNTPAEAHAAMQTALSYKPDVIKVFTDGWRYDKGENLTNMNVQTLTAIVDDAHKAGVKVFTHTVTLEGAKIAARSGVDVLAHGVGDAPVDEELIALLKQHRTSYVSTLSVYEPSRTDVPARVLPALLPQIGQHNLREGTEDPHYTSPPVARRWSILQANVKRVYDAGIPVGIGTDSGVTGTFHGWAALHEIELFVQSGLTPLQALTAATGVSARAVGDDQRGIIAPGKIADLVLVDGAPDQTIQDIERTHAVFLGGRELDLGVLHAAIQTDSMTPLPAVKISALIDDFEGIPGRSSLDTLRIDGTDTGVDHSKITFASIERQNNGRALMILAHMAPKKYPFVDLEIPLTRGAIEPADVSAYHGISFEVRGQGAYSLTLRDYGEMHEQFPSAPFQAGNAWSTVQLPFTSFQQKDRTQSWNHHGVQAIRFELSRPAGSDTWLELDNVRFY